MPAQHLLLDLSSLTLGQPAILGNLRQSLTTLTQELLPRIPCNIPSGNGTPFLLILTLHPSYPIYSQPGDSNCAAIPVWDSVSVSPQQQPIALESASPGCQPGSATRCSSAATNTLPADRRAEHKEPLVWNNREWCWLAPRIDRLPPRELHWQTPDRKSRTLARSSAVMQLLGWTP